MLRGGAELTVYLGEGERTPDGRFAADAIADACARHRLTTSLVLRAGAGFGATDRMRSDRLLTLSDDLPLIVTGVGVRSRISDAAESIEALAVSGLLTVGSIGVPDPTPNALDAVGATKVSVFLARGQRLGGLPAYRAIVGQMRANGLWSSTVLLGVDGAVGGVRRRARFFSRNRDVPLVVVGVGPSASVAALISALGASLHDSLVTVQPVSVWRRSGGPSIDPPAAFDADGAWQKVTVFVSEWSSHRGQPVADRLLGELLRGGAGGATCLRGIWGYVDDDPPHGDGFRRLRRDPPTMLVIVDSPQRIRGTLEIVQRETAHTGLVTYESVKAFALTRPGRALR